MMHGQKNIKLRAFFLHSLYNTSRSIIVFFTSFSPTPVYLFRLPFFDFY